MLSTILTTLQSLIQGRFVVIAFFPMLAFVTFNCVMLAWLNEPSRALAVQTFLEASTSRSTFFVLVALIAIAMLGYIFSALLPGFQLLLEGRWPAWLVSLFVPVQVRQLEELERERHENDNLRASLENPREFEDWAGNHDFVASNIIRPTANNPGHFMFMAVRSGGTAAAAPNFPQIAAAEVDDGGVTWKNLGAAVELPIRRWALRLREARTLGTQHHRGHNAFNLQSPAARSVANLEQLRRRNKPITYEQLNSAVNQMALGLAENDADHPQERTLEISRVSLKQLVEYATDHAYSEDFRLTNKLRFTFGSQRPAPTRMGNIANTIQSYAERRYKLNFEIFWARMQRAIQKDKDFAPVLQQSKMQLDFLISCCVLTGAWSLLWIAISLLVGTGRLSFLSSAVIGPFLAYAWYRAAVAQYQTFADVLRTSIDLFRFELLSDLHVPLPGDLPEEQELWDTLHRIHSYYEPQPLHYQHPKSA
jgi:hypothetical protein